MSGYPAWPGLIYEIGRAIKVLFFGTNNWYVGVPCAQYFLLHCMNAFVEGIIKYDSVTFFFFFFLLGTNPVGREYALAHQGHPSGPLWPFSIYLR